MTNLTPQVEAVLKLASEEAEQLGHSSWGSEHIILALASPSCAGEGRAAEILERVGVNADAVRGLIVRHLPPSSEHDGVGAAGEVGYIIVNTRWIAAYLGTSLAGTEHLLLGALWHQKAESKVLRKLNVTFEGVYRITSGQVTPAALIPRRPVYVSPPGDVAALVRALHKVLPAGASFSFAFDDERAWFGPKPETVNLQEYLPKAMALARGE